MTTIDRLLDSLTSIQGYQADERRRVVVEAYVKQIVAEERERCAKIAENIVGLGPFAMTSEIEARVLCAREIAKEIRSGI